MGVSIGEITKTKQGTEVIFLKDKPVITQQGCLALKSNHNCNLQSEKCLCGNAGLLESPGSETPKYPFCRAIIPKIFGST